MPSLNGTRSRGLFFSDEEIELHKLVEHIPKTTFIYVYISAKRDDVVCTTARQYLDHANHDGLSGDGGYNLGYKWWWKVGSIKDNLLGYEIIEPTPIINLWGRLAANEYSPIRVLDL